jgi:peroxiredoxin
MSRNPSNVLYWLATAFALGVILLAWTGRDRYELVGPGVAAPHFEAVTLAGDTVTIGEYRGRVVLLNIWATWCPPCVEEMPSMQRLYQELDTPDFEIVAVSVDGRRRGQIGPLGRPAGDPGEFARSLGLTFPILWDPDGHITRAYQTVGLPESYVIGRDGTIYSRVTGITEWDHPEYVQFIRRLLDEKG